MELSWRARWRKKERSRGGQTMSCSRFEGSGWVVGAMRSVEGADTAANTVRIAGLDVSTEKRRIGDG